MVIMLSVIVGTSLLTSVISQYYDSKLGTSTDLFTTDFFDKFYTANCSAYTYFAVRFFTPCKDLIISVKKKKGQPYIYVSKTNPYPTRNSLTWATESNLVTIYKTDPNGYHGYYYIGIYNDCSQQSDNASFQIQARESADEPSFSLFYTDIGLHSELSSNKTVDANSFILFSFCLSSCENVRLRLEDCVNKTRCPKDYILPELLVSRQDFLLPSVKDYRYLTFSAFLRCQSFDVTLHLDVVLLSSKLLRIFLS